jgi:hypothetical protein
MMLPVKRKKDARNGTVPDEPKPELLPEISRRPIDEMQHQDVLAERSELAAAKMELIELEGRLKSEIHQAILRARYDGRYSDNEWYADMHRRRDAAAVRLQAINLRISELARRQTTLRREEHFRHHIPQDQKDRLFVKAANLLLPEKKLAEIRKLAELMRIKGEAEATPGPANRRRKSSGQGD